MNSQRQSEQVYFDQCEPEIEQISITPEIELIKEEKMYGSCIIARNAPKTAPTRKHIRVIDHKNKKKIGHLQLEKPTIMITNKSQASYEGSTSPLKGQSPFKKIKPNPASLTTYRNIFASKKQGSQLDSISPQPLYKHQRQSESPVRNHLFLQIDLQGKDLKLENISSISSASMYSTLKFQTDQLPEITAPSYIAMTTDTHEILVQKNIDYKRQIASLTKIMTAYTVIHICHSHGIRIRDHKVTIHQQASWMEGTTANLRTGQEFFIIDLLYGLLLPSGNDAGVALAQHFGKFLSFKLTKDQEEDQSTNPMERFQCYKQFYDCEYQRDSIRLFVFQMNRNCRKIGLKNTQFANPTGLSNSKNYSTAKDMALLTSHCLKNHMLRQIFKRKIYSCEAVNQKMAYVRQVQWKNTNKHLYEFRQCIGVKTGITPAAGPCLSSAYKILNRQIVVIVLNSTSIDDRYQDAKTIYKWCRKNMKISY